MKTDHAVEWMSPAPFWASGMALGRYDAIRVPELLSYASDNFMDDLVSDLNASPDALVTRRARPFTARGRAAGAPESWAAPLPPLTLYQPVHGTFQLVAAQLICRVTGFPDRVVNPSHAERATFVLRKLEGVDEMAWAVADGTPGARRWVPLRDPSTVLPVEERFPLFPVIFNRDGKRRRMLAGLVPTSSRETFAASPNSSTLLPAPGDPVWNLEGDTRLPLFKNRVSDRIQELIDRKNNPPPPVLKPPDPDVPARVEEIETEASQFVILDFADFLQAYLPAVAAVLDQGALPVGPLADLLALLGTPVESPGTITYRVALATALKEFARFSGDDARPPSLAFNLRRTALDPLALYNAVKLALGPWPPAGGVLPTPPEPPVVPKLDPTGGARYVIRHVFERPHCVNFMPVVVSLPTEPFRIAGVFDPDAPARQIRIPMPVDTSIGGLRKYPRNVAFIISDKLRQQIESVTGSKLKDIDDGNVNAGAGFALGEICSFSFAIVMIVALIIMMIFVILLNIVFGWLPLLRICFPIVLKSKG